MSRSNTPKLSPTIPGIMAIVLGILMIALAGPDRPDIWLGGGLLLLGAAATINSIFKHKAATSGDTDVKSPKPIVKDFQSTNPAPSSTGNAQTPQTNYSLPRKSLFATLATNSERILAGCDAITPPLGELTACFTRWIESLDKNEKIWEAFDRWTRDTLNEFLNARRVRCFQVTETNQRIVSLSNELSEAFWPGPAQKGLIDHVVARGRRYVRGASGNGELIEKLANQWSENTDPGRTQLPLSRAPDWMVPVCDKGKTIGLIVVGELPDDVRSDLGVLQAIGHLLELYWLHVGQCNALSIAQRTDRASGVLNRIDLNSLVENVLKESVAEGEPIVVLALSVEGVRRLDDQGQWELRDWMMQEIGLEMRRKLRSDDLVGRFSDDRFVAFLRRLDISLGKLIAGKMLAAVKERISCHPVINEVVKLRCGLAEQAGRPLITSKEQSEADGGESALSCAFEALRQARDQRKDIVVFSPDEARNKPKEAGVMA